MAKELALVKDADVVKRINEIDGELSKYSTIQSNISSLIEDLIDCRKNLNDTYRELNNALEVKNEAFNQSKEGISTLADKYTTHIDNLYTIDGMIDNDIQKLENEREKLSKRIYV